MDNWIEYWSQETQFVCDHHMHLSYQATYEDFKSYVDSSDSILDFGCGEGLFASQLSQNCNTLFLYDAAESILDRIRLNNNHSNVKIVNSYQDIKILDLVLISSISQYIPEQEFIEILKNLKSSIVPNGKIIISDIIPLKNSILIEALDLLKIAIQNGFFAIAILKILSSLLGNYSKVRRLLPLTKYDINRFQRNMEQLGFLCKVQENNLGLNSNRLTVALTRID